MSDSLTKVILFDDDPENLRLYSGMFADHFQVETFQNPFHYTKALKHDLSAILIDVLMPVMNGPELYKEIIKDPSYNGCPLIFITASKSEEIMLDALSTGGDDLLSREMKTPEMILRIQNQITHFHHNRTIFGLGNVRLDMREPVATNKKGVLPLTLIELKILKILIIEYPGLCEREKINQKIWPGMKVLPTTLNTHLSNLRQKLSDWEYEIRNIKNHGIQLELKTK